MATTGRADEAEPAADVAASCRDADFVGLVGATDGDALAAVGLLARALADAGVAFQARLAPAPADPAPGTEADRWIAVGVATGTADHAIAADGDGPATERAAAVAAELAEPDPALALAGRVAAGRPAEESSFAEQAPRRPGVGVPTAELADGLAHTTLLHAPFSGDPDAVAAELADLPDDPDERGRRVASILALSVVGDRKAPPRAATAVGRALRPHVGGPFETIEGYADVLSALARSAPGPGLAAALGQADREAALDAWRDHGRHVHEAVESADLERRDGLAIAMVETAVPAPVARLLRDFRSPDPAVLVVGDQGAALATTEDGPDARSLLAAATDETSVRGSRTLSTAPIEDEATVLAALEGTR